MQVAYISYLIVSFVSSCSGITCPGICTCYDGGTVVDCTGRSLSSVPDSLKSVGGVLDEINLSNNNIGSIHLHDFQGIRVRKIDLSDNSITTIENGTFENVFVDNAELDLSSNNLTVLPIALVGMPTMHSLDVRNNPTTTICSHCGPIALPDLVMREMGDTLQVFYFGHPFLASWPSSLRHFQDLKELTLDQADRKLENVPSTAFHSFQSTLNKLTIKNTKMITVPMGVSQLRNLKEFYFDDNKYVGDDGVIVQSFFREKGSPIEILSLQGDSLTEFPRALSYLSNMKTLYMNNNTLQFISDDEVASLKITDLHLQNCSLQRIPGALSAIENLVSLDLSNNQIVSIENNDVTGLLKIVNISLSHNPIKFLSRDTFNSTPTVRQVDVSYTHLTTIDDAFRFSNIASLDLTGNKITCMCEYYWVKTHRCHLQVDGACGNIDTTITTYLNSYIPDCPLYKECSLDPKCKNPSC